MLMWNTCMALSHSWLGKERQDAPTAVESSCCHAVWVATIASRMVRHPLGKETAMN